MAKKNFNGVSKREYARLQQESDRNREQRHELSSGKIPTAVYTILESGNKDAISTLEKISQSTYDRLTRITKGKLPKNDNVMARLVDAIETVARDHAVASSDFAYLIAQEEPIRDVQPV